MQQKQKNLRNTNIEKKRQFGDILKFVSLYIHKF
jgi:hypothetical protein